jgi:4-methyl-5(b-hydroxyethyl)-thiazole monophosphate biosynthesis
MVLAEAGILYGKQATCDPGSLDARPGVTLSSEAVVQDGKVLTSRGPGTAMDFALALVGALAGAERRQQVEAALVRP